MNVCRRQTHTGSYTHRKKRALNTVDTCVGAKQKIKSGRTPLLRNLENSGFNRLWATHPVHCGFCFLYLCHLAGRCTHAMGGCMCEMTKQPPKRPITRQCCAGLSGILHSERNRVGQLAVVVNNTASPVIDPCRESL